MHFTLRKMQKRSLCNILFLKNKSLPKTKRYKSYINYFPDFNTLIPLSDNFLMPVVGFI